MVALRWVCWGVSVWWWSIVELLRGLVPIVLILLGLVALGAGVTRMREKGSSYSEPEELQDDIVSVEE
nr:magnetosome protein MamI [uncultured bacterium]